MYLYTIPQSTQQSTQQVTQQVPQQSIPKYGGSQTKLKKQYAGRIHQNIQTKKLNRANNLNGGFLGIDFCKIGKCHMPKKIYKATKDEMLPHLLAAFNIKRDDTFKDKFEDIVENVIDSGLMRQFLHGVNAKMGQNRKYLDSDKHKYLDHIKTFIKLLVLSATPEAYTYIFPNSYQKYNSDGKRIDEMGSVRNQEITVSKSVISPEILLNIIDNILKADKENLSVDKIRQSDPTFSRVNSFIYDDSLNAITNRSVDYERVNTVLYFYNTSSCVINDLGNTQHQDNCKVIFTFNTKQSTLSDRELTKNDFVCVESNFKQIRAYCILLSNSSDKKKYKLYKAKIIALLSDSYKIKHYIDGCIKFINFMEKFKSGTAKPNLFKKYITVT